jgi:hypothetical protein
MVNVIFQTSVMADDVGQESEHYELETIVGQLTAFSLALK